MNDLPPCAISLEDLLNQGQPEPVALCLAILREHSTPLSRLSLALTGSMSPGLVQVLAAAVRQARRFRPEAGVRRWLYPLAWQALLKFQPAALAPVTEAPEGADAVLWRTLDALGGRERRLAILRHGLGFPAEEAAVLLRVSVVAAEAQHALNRQAFREALVVAGFTALIEDEMLDAQVGATLERRWAAPVFTEDSWLALAREAATLAQEQQIAWDRQAPLRLLGKVGVVLGVAACLALAAILLSPRGASTRMANIQPLSLRSSSEAIRARLELSAALWREAFLEAQIIVYGPSGYIGPARLYRLQAWIRQPGQSLELFGLLDGHPATIQRINAGSRYRLSPLADQAELQPWSNRTEALLSTHAVQQMVFPRVSPWVDELGYFLVREQAEIAGRQAIVTDWLDAENNRLWRLWLDAMTGMPLRTQEFSPYDTQTMRAETILTTLVFEPGQDFSEVFQPGPLVGLDFAMTQSTSAASLGEPPPESTRPAGETPPEASRAGFPQPAVAIPVRPALPGDQTPAGLDPAQRWLTFQFSFRPDQPVYQQEFSNAPVELFADGYFLGELNFGFPWSVACQRSADGRLVAFSLISDGASPAEAGLRWFNLSDPQRVYLSLPGVRVTEFAFAPGGRQLAAFGHGSAGLVTGLYLVDIPSGEAKLLLELPLAEGLAWSPEGEQLGLVGLLPTQFQPTVLALHVRTGQVIFQAESWEPGQPVPVDWPMAGWGRPFPQSTGGMEACIVPPGAGSSP